MIDQIFKDIADETILENVPLPWIFSVLSAVNTETANMGMTVTLNAKSTVKELKDSIELLPLQSQAHIVQRAFNQFNTATRESTNLHESIKEIEATKTKHKLISAGIYTFLGLIAFLVVSTIIIASLGSAAQIDERLGITLFETLIKLYTFLFENI